MSDYMPKCATCKHFESCIIQKHLTEMALILWNINREEEKEKIEETPIIKQSTWIPCNERLPNDNREVLISLEWGIDIGTYERGEWRSEWINHYDDDNVLAWMPLPQLYKREDK